MYAYLYVISIYFVVVLFVYVLITGNDLIFVSQNVNVYYASAQKNRKTYIYFLNIILLYLKNVYTVKHFCIGFYN